MSITFFDLARMCGEAQISIKVTDEEGKMVFGVACGRYQPILCQGTSLEITEQLREQIPEYLTKINTKELPQATQTTAAPVNISRNRKEKPAAVKAAAVQPDNNTIQLELF